MPTMLDVANAAGVSKSTVSNALNNPYSVSEDKYRKVMSAVQSLNYTPNANASNLRTSKRNTLAIIVPELSSYYSQISEQIITELSPKNYNCTLWLTHYSSQIEEDYLKRCLTSGVSGVFLCTCTSFSNPILDILLENRIPVVLIGSSTASIQVTTVQRDNYSVAFVTADNAISNFFSKHENVIPENISVVTGPSSIQSESDISKGFTDAYLKYFPEQQPISIRLSPELACIDFLNEMLGRDNRLLPELIICSSASASLGIRKACEYLHLKSEIVLLKGDTWYDNSFSEENSISLDALALGNEAASVMEEYIQNPVFFESKHIILDTLPTIEKKIAPFFIKPSTTIKLLLYNRPWADIIQKIIPIFERQFSVKVDCECTSNSVELMERVRHFHENENLHSDAFVLPHYCLKYFNNDDYMLNMNEYIERDELNLSELYPPEITRIALLDQEKIYALPIAFNTQLLFYRKDLFERDDIRRMYYREYGIELAPPKTWTDFEIISHFFTRQFNPDSPVPFGTSFAMTPQSSLVEEFYPREWAYHGRIVSKTSGKPILNSLQNIQAMNNLLKAYECTPKAEDLYSNVNHSMRILNNDIAMHNTFATYIPNNMGPGSIDYKRIGYTNTPGGTPLLSGWMMGISKHSKHPDETFAFIRWLMQKRSAEQNAFLGLFNPQTELLNDVHCQRVFPWTASFLHDMEKAGLQESMTTIDGNVIFPRTIVELVHQGINKALVNNISAEDILNEMNAQLELLYYHRY